MAAGEDQLVTAPSSSIYGLLPSVIKSRVPKLISLRRSVSRYGISTHDAETIRPSSSGRAGTPPPTYLAAVHDDLVVNAESSDELDEEASRNMEMDRAAPCSLNPFSSVRADETASGVGWRYASQGLTLLTQSFRESSQLTPQAGAFARQLYLDSLMYQLRGLPGELSLEERLSLRSALPEDLTEPLSVSVVDGQLLVVPSQGNEAAQQSASDERPLLHRLLAAGILQLFLMAHFLLPYLKIFMSELWKYERKHHVSERAVRMSVETIDRVGKAVWGLQEGRVGKALEDMIEYCFESVVGGMHEGVGEGMAVFGMNVHSGRNGGRLGEQRGSEARAA